MSILSRIGGAAGRLFTEKSALILLGVFTLIMIISRAPWFDGVTKIPVLGAILGLFVVNFYLTVFLGSFIFFLIKSHGEFTIAFLMAIIITILSWVPTFFIG